MSAQLDTNYQVETPEGIDLHAQLAGPVPRSLAYLIDMGLRLALLAVVAVVLTFAGTTGMGIYLLLSFLLEWFYPVLFEVYWKGQTPGKKMMDLLVVNDDLTPVNWSTSLVRNLLRAVDFLPFAYLGGLVAMVLGERFQRMGDLAAGTLVIHRVDVSDMLSLPDVEPRPAHIPLTLEDQIAITSFAQRHQQLTQSRQQELAEILSETLNCPHDQAVNTLQGIGSWLLGGKR